MRFLLGLAAALLVAHAASADVSPAQAEALGRLYAEAVNSDAAVDAYLKRDVEGAPPAAIRNFFDDQRWITGGGVEMVGVRVRPGAPAIVDVAVRGRLYGAVQGIELRVDDAPEPRITLLDLVPAPAWALAATKPQPASTLAGRVKRLVDRGCAAGVFSGAVLVAQGDRIVMQQACGEASRRYHAPNTLKTRFNLGSMDKMFTAVAAMQLAEAGKLDLDATLDRYLDATWIAPEVARKVTVWQLMSHSSGLAPDLITLVQQGDRRRFRDLVDYRALTKDLHTTFPPGSQYEYSNTGMILLGAVVEAASGQRYDAYVHDHVLAPAGMTATASLAADDPDEDVATGYERVPKAPHGWRENTMRNLVRGVPAGGGYSTVGDLHRFALALTHDRLVSVAGRTRLWTDTRGVNYGAGFELVRGAVGRTAGHSGFFPGVSTKMRIYPDRGYVVVVLANIDRAAPPLVDAIENELVATRP